jgi:hypothetical protein
LQKENIEVALAHPTLTKAELLTISVHRPLRTAASVLNREGEVNGVLAL